MITSLSDFFDIFHIFIVTLIYTTIRAHTLIIPCDLLAYLRVSWSTSSIWLGRHCSAVFQFTHLRNSIRFNSISDHTRAARWKQQIFDMPRFLLSIPKREMQTKLLKIERRLFFFLHCILYNKLSMCQANRCESARFAYSWNDAQWKITKNVNCAISGAIANGTIGEKAQWEKQEEDYGELFILFPLYNINWWNCSNKQMNAIR